MNRSRFVLTGVLLIAADASADTIAVGDLTVSVLVETTDSTSGSWSRNVAERAQGIFDLTLRFEAAEPAAPPPLTLEWSLPSHDVRGQWTSRSNLDKSLDPDWMPTTVQAKLARDAPVMTLFGAADRNVSTIAVSDALNTATLSCAVREENARIYCRVLLLAEPHRAVTQHEVSVRFDSRSVPLHRALAGVAEWWAAQPGYQPAPVPPAAREPVYSTWYSYHQLLSAPALLREVELARQLGMRTIIVDDGWQTLDSRRGYAYTGDWKPERLPGLEELVRAVHDLDVRFVLWYAVPFAGEKSAALADFDGKFLRYWDGQGAYVLDPRYPAVRERILETYTSAIRDWNLDGFKLDFIERFVADEKTSLTLADGRDYASVNEATDRLLTDLMTSARQLRPDIMIEFRQPYVGPLMRKYGNMFRAGDVPNAYVANRVRTLDLRLLSGDTAVHSDMLMWHAQEPVEQAAFQLLNVMFSVPQVSVRLAEIPVEHTEMLAFYLDYWSRNRAVLLDGDLVPTDAMANYPRVAAYGEAKTIVALYQELVATLGPAHSHAEVDVINAKPGSRVVVDALADLGQYDYTVRDSRGRSLSEGVVRFSAGLHAFEVPVSGLLQLVRRSSVDQ